MWLLVSNQYNNWYWKWEQRLKGVTKAEDKIGIFLQKILKVQLSCQNFCTKKSGNIIWNNNFQDNGCLEIKDYNVWKGEKKYMSSLIAPAISRLLPWECELTQSLWDSLSWGYRVKSLGRYYTGAIIRENNYQRGKSCPDREPPRSSEDPHQAFSWVWVQCMNEENTRDSKG